jgi:hypothetical protein
MPTITVQWDLTDAEYADLRAFVASEGVGGESAEAYASRIGLKGLKGQLGAIAGQRQNRVVGSLVKAFLQAPPQDRVAALAPLGYEIDAVGNVVRIGGEPEPEAEVEVRG